MKKLLGWLPPLLLFLAGLCVLFYPTASDLWNQYRQERLISQYTAVVENLSQEDDSEYWQAAYAYNAALDSGLSDAFSGQQPDSDDEYWGLLNLDGTGIMGYLEIPSIGLRLAIYHGTGEDVLQHGVGHLAGTSLPVGGESTHCVLAAHRGLPSALLFTDLDQMAIGDMFYLYVLGETLAYQVDSILVVEPYDVSALTITEGADQVTLVTCTPYGVNTHRLLVRGSRVPMEEEETPETVTTVQRVSRSLGWQGKLVIALAAAVLMIAVLLLAGKTVWKKRKIQ